MTENRITQQLLEENIKTFTIGNWKTRTYSFPLDLISTEIYQLEKLAKFWSEQFNYLHQNWISKEFNVPSIIIRFDYVVGDNGNVNVFEIEDRPAGFEIDAVSESGAFEKFISTLIESARIANKNLGICISKERMFNSDDYYWIQRLPKEIKARIVLGEVPSNPENSIWFVRSLRTEKEYFELSPYSLTTIEFEGDKSYGVKMGLWNEITTVLPWDRPFVVKPDAGCRCENVHMYHPGKPSGGYSSRSKIQNAIENSEVRYVQEYYSPEFPDFLPENYAMIRRCYLTFDFASLSYKVIGGLWEARPKCHKIHGASDAVCGPLKIKD